MRVRPDLQLRDAARGAGGDGGGRCGGRDRAGEGGEWGQGGGRREEETDRGIGGWRRWRGGSVCGEGRLGEVRMIGACGNERVDMDGRWVN